METTAYEPEVQAEEAQLEPITTLEDLQLSIEIALTELIERTKIETAAEYIARRVSEGVILTNEEIQAVISQKAGVWKLTYQITNGKVERLLGNPQLARTSQVHRSGHKVSTAVLKAKWIGYDLRLDNGVKTMDIPKDTPLDQTIMRDFYEKWDTNFATYSNKHLYYLDPSDGNYKRCN